MELPNLVEEWRTDYTLGTMEILWRGESAERLLLREEGVMKDLGWEIMEEENIDRPWYTHFQPRRPGSWHDDEWQSTRFMLKRKELTGTLLASDPYPDPWRKTRYHQ